MDFSYRIFGLMLLSESDAGCKVFRIYNRITSNTTKVISIVNTCYMFRLLSTILRPKRVAHGAETNNICCG